MTLSAHHMALAGKQAARNFYDQLVRDIHTEAMVPVRSYYGDDFCVIEHEWRDTVRGALFGVEGHGRQIAFRLLHIFEFHDSVISRENAWFDVGAMLRQLTTPSAATTAER